MSNQPFSPSRCAVPAGGSSPLAGSGTGTALPTAAAATATGQPGTVSSRGELAAARPVLRTCAGNAPTAAELAVKGRPAAESRGHFDQHGAKVPADASVIVRTVVADGVVAGHAAVFGPPAEREVTYVAGRAHRGQGIATPALTELVGLEPARPPHADAAADNSGSTRVLEKCGSVSHRTSWCFARARGEEIGLVHLTPDRAGPRPGSGSSGGHPRVSVRIRGIPWVGRCTDAPYRAAAGLSNIPVHARDAVAPSGPRAPAARLRAGEPGLLRRVDPRSGR
ncbi:GNAT family N-acetyltransferase [Streptomyces fagopyri]|uniref:GNAT family N-acetyltransferase n=1 Tax=Streptomyces fagopyri TaxID=2662397 RepID=UPI003721AA95